MQMPNRRKYDLRDFRPASRWPSADARQRCVHQAVI